MRLLAAGVRLTGAPSCDPEVLEIRTVVLRLSAACGSSLRLDAAPSAMSRVFAVKLHLRISLLRIVRILVLITAIVA